MPAQWQIGVQFTGDTTGLSKAMQDAQQMYQKSQASATAASTAVDQAEARLAAAQLQRSQATSAAMQGESDKQVLIAQRALDKRKAAYTEAVGQAEAAERNLTQTVQAESEKRTAAALSSAKQMASGFAQGLGFGAAVGGAMMAGQEIGQALKSATTDYANFGHEISNTALLMNTSAQNASVLRFNMEQLGIDANQSTKMIVSLTRDVQSNAAEFKALGIETHDANGHLLNAYDTFTNLRQVISAAGSDNDKLATIMLTVAKATGGSTQSMADYERLLSMTNEQWAAGAKLAGDMGLVMNDQTAAAAEALYQQFKLVNAEQKGLAMGLSTALSPAVEWATHALLVGIEVAKNYGGVLWDLISLIGQAAATITNPIGAARAIINGQDPLGAIKQAWTSLTTDFANAGTWDQITTKVDNTIAAAKSLGEQLAQTGSSLPAPVSGKGSAAGPTVSYVQEAMKRDIAAITEAAKDNQQRLTDALAADQKEGASKVAMLDLERKALAETYAAAIAQAQDAETAAATATARQIQGWQDELAARQDLRDAEVAAISATKQANDDAYNDRVAQRTAELADLQKQLAAIGKVDQVSTDQAAVDKAQAALAVERAKDMQRIRSETLDAYAARVLTHNTTLTQLEAALATAQETQADNVAKAKIQSQIDAVTAAGIADQTTQAESTKTVAQQIADIKKISDADKTATADRVTQAQRAQQAMADQTKATIDDLQNQAKADDKAFGIAIDNFKAALANSKTLADAQIADSKRVTDAVITDLQKQLTAMQTTDQQKRLLAADPGGKVTVPWSGATVSSQEYANAVACESDGRHQWNWSDHTCFAIATPAASSAGGGATTAPANNVAGLTPAIVAANPSLTSALHNAGIPGYAGGGTMLLREPAMLLGLNSGRPLATVAETGSEEVGFGSAVGAGGGREVHVQPVVLEIDGRVVAEIVSRHQGELAVVKGYAVRR